MRTFRIIFNQMGLVMTTIDRCQRLVKCISVDERFKYFLSPKHQIATTYQEELKQLPIPSTPP